MKRSCLVALVACSIDTTHAEPAVTVETHYYAIVGTSERELRQQMHRFGPKDSGGAYDAYTRWYVRWRYDYKQDGNQCDIARVATSVEVTFTLPDWKNFREAPNELQHKWRSYMRALKEHEDGHKAIGVAAAAEIEEAIAAMPSAASCADLSRNANAIGERIINKRRLQEREYDVHTQHGATQGAVFP